MLASLLNPDGWAEAFAQAGIAAVLSCWFTLLLIGLTRR